MKYKKSFAKGSPEREELTRTLQQMKQKLPQKIPITVSGKVVSERLKIKMTKKKTGIVLTLEISSDQLHN